MGTELDTRHVLNPVTGEALDLAAPTDELAQWLDELREFESRSREVKRLLSRTLLERMDAQASWTLREGGFELRGESPGRVEYDGEKLVEALKELVVDERITLDAAERACERVVSYKPKVSGINALKKLGGEVAERIDACASPVDPERRRVTVKRAT